MHSHAERGNDHSRDVKRGCRNSPSRYASQAYSTVTDFARLRGWSTSVPLSTAT